MDTITQGLLGAVTAQLGFRQRIGPVATWVAAGAAIVPDLDILIEQVLALTGTEPGDLNHLSTHRGLSHSLLIVPLISFVIALLWKWVRRGQTGPPAGTEDGPPSKAADKPSFCLLYACVFVAVLSHPLLDWCTSYGTQMLSPITSRRFALDAVPIIDIIFTPILILTLIGCYSVRKIKTQPRKLTLAIGWIGFGLSVSYLAAGYALNRIIVSDMQKHDPTPSTAEYHAYPQLFTIFVWRVTRQTPDEWNAARVNMLFGDDLKHPDWTQAKIVDNVWTSRALALPEARLFRWFAMEQIRATDTYHHGMRMVDLHDMRYGIRPESLISLWSLRIALSDAGQVLAIERVRNYRQGSLTKVIGQAWQDIWNP